jgi:transcriptional regulator with XRE-family HTH domain
MSTDYDTAAIVERIKDALAKHPTLNATTLAERIGFDKSKMSRLLGGTRSVSAAEAAAIADALEVPASWIVTGAKPTPPRPRAVAARLAAESPAGFKPVSDRAGQLLEVRALLEQIVAMGAPEPPALDVPHHDTWRVRAGATCAKRLRAALELGDESIADINALIETHFRVDVSRQPMDANLAGLLVRDPDAPALTGTALMLVNSACAIGRQRFTAAHELAHLLFADTGLLQADWMSEADKSLTELRADAFAAELLAPGGGVNALVSAAGPKPDGDTAKWVASAAAAVAVRYRLSVGAALRRLRTLEHITGDEYNAAYGRRAQDVMVDGGAGDYVAAIVEHDNVIDPPAALTEQALHAYSAGLVGLGTMAALYGADDQRALADELAAAGWVPTFD